MKRWVIAMLILTTQVSAENQMSTGDSKTMKYGRNSKKMPEKSPPVKLKQTTFIRVMDQNCTQCQRKLLSVPT